MLYTRKAQVLFTKDQFIALQEISFKTHKKIGALIREAVVKTYIDEKRKTDIAQAVDNILTLPPTPAPANYNNWEKEYTKSELSH